jgi:hypothetical protein
LCRNCLIKHVIEGKIEEAIKVRGRQGRWRKQLLDDLKGTRGYWKLKQEAIDCTVWRTDFGRGYGSVVRHVAVWKNKWIILSDNLQQSSLAPFRVTASSFCCCFNLPSVCLILSHLNFVLYSLYLKKVLEKPSFASQTFLTSDKHIVHRTSEF